MNKEISTVDFDINIIDKEFQISDGIKEMDRVCQQIVQANELVKKTKEDIKATPVKLNNPFSDLIIRSK